jgi:two-component system, chemotaxis family, chemotaxis protein CheY
MLDQSILFGSNKDGTKPRVLVVEDDTLHRMMICRAAAVAGYAPAGAATYDEAAKFLRQDPFDCITLDLTLGVRTGADVLRHLADIGSTAHIIIVSGRDEDTCEENVELAKSLNLNILGSMQKPIDPAELRSWLERLKSKDAAAVAVA